MQGADFSKSMFPCVRRVHLHKSASFKLIRGKIQTNPTNNAKSGPKMIEKTI